MCEEPRQKISFSPPQQLTPCAGSDPIPQPRFCPSALAHLPLLQAHLTCRRGAQSQLISPQGVLHSAWRSRQSQVPLPCASQATRQLWPGQSKASARGEWIDPLSHTAARGRRISTSRPNPLVLAQITSLPRQHYQKQVLGGAKITA